MKYFLHKGLSFPEESANKALATLTVDRCDLSDCAPLIAGAAKKLSSVILTDSSVNEAVCNAIGACGKIKIFIAQDVKDMDIPLILSLWAANAKD